MISVKMDKVWYTTAVIITAWIILTGGCITTTTTTTTSTSTTSSSTTSTTTTTTSSTTTSTSTTTTSTRVTTTIEEPEDRGWVFTDENRKCIIEKQKKFGYPGSYIPSRISVRFNPGISELEAKNLVKSYGLNPVDSFHARTDNSYFIFIDVSKGFELHWVCEFEKNNKVQYARLVLVLVEA